MKMKPTELRGEDLPGVTILIPAFNEEKVIVNTVENLLNLDYPNLTFIVIDDGSDDNTSVKVVERFRMRHGGVNKTADIPTAPVEEIYVSEINENLILIRKANGGKADALNAGLNFSKGEIIVTIDADTVLAPRSVRRLVGLFKDQNAAAVGGLLTVANEAVIKNGRPVSVKFPGNPLVIFQLIEYLVSYSIGRGALSRIDSLLVLSGAFSAFRRELLISVGGFLSRISHGRTTVCEDMEIVVRLHRYLKERRIPYPIKFHFFPVAWTEVPSSLSNILRQRNRWHRGLGESLMIHSDMLFNPRYRHIGLFAVPYYTFFEFLSPIAKLFSTVLILILLFMRLVHWQFVIILFLLVVALNGLYTSIITTMVELKFKNISTDNMEAMRFKTLGDWIKLILMSFFLEPVYGAIRTVAQLWGIWDLFRGKSGWYKFEREGMRSQNQS